MELAERIQTDLQKYDLVLLIVDGAGVAENLMADFFCSQALKKTAKKVLILSQEKNINQMGRSDEYCLDGEFQWSSEYRQISDKEQRELCRLYRMYEFSDHFQILADCSQFGGMLNYVKTGILTKEEMFELVLK